MESLQFLELSAVANHLSLGFVCPKWACEQGDSMLFPWPQAGPQGLTSYSAFAFGLETVHRRETLVIDEVNRNRGLKRQYSKQDIDARRVWGEHQTFPFPSCCPIWIKDFILGESFFRVMETVLQTHGDGWDRDEHGGVRRRAWDEDGSHSSLTSHSCLSSGEPCRPCGGNTQPLFRKRWASCLSSKRQTQGATIQKRSSMGEILGQRR